MMKRFNFVLGVIFALVLVPVLSVAQVVINPGVGGSGTTTIAIGTTAITGGTATRVLRESSGNVVTEDANLTNDGSTVTIGTGISGTNKALIITNATSTGNILEAQDNVTTVFTIADGGVITKTAAMRAEDGVVGTPAYSFTSDSDTGFWWRTSGSIEISSNGSHVASFNNGGNLVMGSARQMGWTNIAAASNAPDVGMQRVAAAVMGVTDGSSGTGWVQTSGEIALNADYTNATASFTSTALSVTVISGRTYNFTFSAFFSDSTAADGAQFDFNGGSAAATNFRAHCTAANATGAALAMTNANTTALATAVQVALALTTQANITCQGTFVPSGNGTFIIRAAQTAHSTGTLTVNRGSWLSIRDARPL